MNEKYYEKHFYWPIYGLHTKNFTIFTFSHSDLLLDSLPLQVVDADRSSEIDGLVHTLPSVINAALAQRTSAQYLRSWKAWKCFCKGVLVVLPRPADPYHAAMHVNQLLRTQNSKAAITNAIHGII